MFSVGNKVIGCNVSLIIRLKLQKNKSFENHANFSISPVKLVFSPNQVSGYEYLRNPHLNKGLAFTMKERKFLGLKGLLAADIKTQEQQVEICRLSFDKFKHPLSKYLYLNELQGENVRLFYSLLASDIEKYLPIVYTPTVGLACQRFGCIYKQFQGLFISIRDKGNILRILKNWPVRDVYAIVVTDGERILGLGDLGAFGMGIPIGKLSLYTALAGVKPHKCLPVLLDVGCNNEKLTADPFYIGLRQKRQRGQEYVEFCDEFMYSCIKLFGRKVLIQFEDFAMENANSLLARYRDKYCVFNDDIQGTAAVVVAGLITATKITKKKISENTYLFFGAGAAAVGIANLLVDLMVEENVPKQEGYNRIYLFNIDGLLTTKRRSDIPPHAKNFVKNLEPMQELIQAVKEIKPTCLIGASTVGSSFTPEVLKQMAQNADRPVIFALSNPTHKAECSPQDAYDHTEGRCLYASGSPFPPVKYNGKEYRTGQGNNSYIFPGLGLAVTSVQMAHIADSDFLLAAKVVANNVADSDISVGRLFPSLRSITSVSMEIAKAVANEAYKTNVARLFPKPQNIDEFIMKQVYNLKYPNHAPE